MRVYSERGYYVYSGFLFFFPPFEIETRSVRRLRRMTRRILSSLGISQFCIRWLDNSVHRIKYLKRLKYRWIEFMV